MIARKSLFVRLASSSCPGRYFSADFAGGASIAKAGATPATPTARNAIPQRILISYALSRKQSAPERPQQAFRTRFFWSGFADAATIVQRAV